MRISVYLKAFWPIYLLFAVLVFLIAQGSSQSITAWSEEGNRTYGTVIILDAGHGGEDGGAISCTGALESQINLQIALRLRDLFHLLGFETFMTRESDISVYTQGDTLAAKKVSDLRNRVKMVNETANSVLISIHQNTFPMEQYYGAQVFSNKSAVEVAENLQNVFITTLNSGSHRKNKLGDGIYLLEKIQQPGVLVECGFLSNAAEESRLRDAQYQKKICCVIASVFSSYLAA